MHPFQLRLNIERFLKLRSIYNPFFDLVSELDKWASQFEGPIGNMASRTEASDAVQIHKIIRGARGVVANGGIRQVFKAIDQFKEDIAGLAPDGGDEGELVADLLRESSGFEQLYDKFVATSSPSDALPVLRAAVRLKIKIQLFFDALRMFMGVSGADPEPGDEEAILSLWLPARLDLKAFVEKLSALNALYSELCILFSVSESDHPLRIAKIESGSLWAKVFGDIRIIGMMVDFMREGALWVYRNYTVEGKVASVPRKVEAIDSLLGLSQRLKEAGHDISDLRPHIDKAAVSIAKELSTLLDDQPSVTVNEQSISLHEYGSRQLGAAAQRQLTNDQPNGR